MSASKVVKKALQIEWANNEAGKRLTNSDLKLWSSMGSTHVVYLGSGRNLLVWKLVNGKPQPLKKLVVDDISLSFHRGLTINLLGPYAEPIIVTHTPSRLPGLDVFAWCAGTSELRWTPLNYDRPDGPRILVVPMSLKIMNNPHKELVEGNTYVNSVSEFRSIWPDYADLKF